MYVSHAVRSLREDPIEGETIALALTTSDDADPDAVAAAVEDLGGTVERRLQFDDLAVSVPQSEIAAICAIDGLDVVETADTISIASLEDSSDG